MAGLTETLEDLLYASCLHDGRGMGPFEDCKRIRQTWATRAAQALLQAEPPPDLRRADVLLRPMTGAGALDEPGSRALRGIGAVVAGTSAGAYGVWGARCGDRGKNTSRDHHRRAVAGRSREQRVRKRTRSEELIATRFGPECGRC